MLNSKMVFHGWAKVSDYVLDYESQNPPHNVGTDLGLIVPSTYTI